MFEWLWKCNCTGPLDPVQPSFLRAVSSNNKTSNNNKKLSTENIKTFQNNDTTIDKKNKKPKDNASTSSAAAELLKQLKVKNKNITTVKNDNITRRPSLDDTAIVTVKNKNITRKPFFDDTATVKNNKNEDDDGIDICFTSTSKKKPISSSHKQKTRSLKACVRRYTSPPIEDDNDEGIDLCTASTKKTRRVSQQPLNVKICHGCGQKILSHQASACFSSDSSKINFHKRCVVCTTCSKPITNTFNIINKSLYCIDCSKKDKTSIIPNNSDYEKFNLSKNEKHMFNRDICASCTKMFKDNEITCEAKLPPGSVTLLFHPDCFKCKKCNKKFRSPAMNITYLNSSWLCDTCGRKEFVGSHC